MFLRRSAAPASAAPGLPADILSFTGRGKKRELFHFERGGTTGVCGELAGATRALRLKASKRSTHSQRRRRVATAIMLVGVACCRLLLFSPVDVLLFEIVFHFVEDIRRANLMTCF